MLDAQIFYGNPADAKLWEELAEYLARPWQHPAQKEFRIAKTFVDSGYETQAVYQFIKRSAGQNVSASKGVGGENRPPVGRASKNNTARINVFPIGTNAIKTVIFSRLKNEIPGPGYFHIGSFADEEFLRQLTSEKAVKRYSRGIPRIEYQKLRPRNEALDLLVLNLAAFASLNANTGRMLSKLSETRKPEKENLAYPLRMKTKKPSWVKRFR